MDEINVMLKDYIQECLADAPDSVAKAELVEELTENLCCRYYDMLDGGMEPEQAKAAAMDALGDTGELVEYLAQFEADEPLPDPVEETAEETAQLDEIWKNVEGILRGVASKAKRMARSAVDTMEESGVISAKTEEEVKNAVKGAMEEVKKAVKEAGGAVQGAYQEVKASCEKTPVSTEEPVCAETIRAIDVQAGSGDVTIRFTQEPEGNVLVGGDIDDLEVYRTNDGMLNIRPVQTAAASFLFGRGVSRGRSADVELELPVRAWDLLRIYTTSGDVEIDGNTAVGMMEIHTVSGDVEGNLAHCDLLECKTTSGDIKWWGQVSDLHVETTSGDSEFRSNVQRAWLKSTSGDVTIHGDVAELHAKTVSGDVTLRNSVPPEVLDVNSVSGDLTMRKY